MSRKGSSKKRRSKYESDIRSEGTSKKRHSKGLSADPNSASIKQGVEEELEGAVRLGPVLNAKPEQDDLPLVQQE